MTNRDKQIEEMTKDLCDIDCKGMKCDNCDHYGCEYRMQAEALYNAGYRKADEVAREIIADFKDILLDYHLQEDKKYVRSSSNSKKQFEIETARYRAITDAVKFAIETLNEIEKKYAEGEG